ncbi:MAG: phospho-sugar mutase [Myxococcota bacterium]
MDELVRGALAWIADDPDPETARQAQALVDGGDRDALAACFVGRLAFGTAGIRAPIGPGPARINRATIRRITAGLAVAVTDGAGPVVVGFDGRRGSATFAEDAARVLTGAGIPVVRFRAVCPTPVLAYAVRALGGRAGVMVTASHNPPQDNGYKVYGPDGAQIVAPIDAAITRAMDALGPTASLPLGPDGAEPHPDLVRRYVEAVIGLRVHAPHRRVRIAYTPLHGVGADTLLAVLAAAGYADVHVVPEQAEPDGAFPTVAFPNPEERGALDRVEALAARIGADLVLANDPDADRIAVSVPTGSSYRRLTGNETGTLLAEDLLANGLSGPRRVATTVVSSSLLSRIAAGHGADYVETLTGFKWIARVAGRTDARFVLGYEEALGVCPGDVVRDKDGISSALLVADLASHLADQERTLVDAIDDLHRRYGVHAGGQVVLASPVAETVVRMRTLRAAPPTALGAAAVTRVVDYLAAPVDGLPTTDLLAYHLDVGDRVLVRPSGTEPKLKAYVEVVEPIGIGTGTGTGDGAAGLDDARGRAQARLGELLGAVRTLLQRAGDAG